jgi:hypothetical protein
MFDESKNLKRKMCNDDTESCDKINMLFKMFEIGTNNKIKVNLANFNSSIQIIKLNKKRRSNSI